MQANGYAEASRTFLQKARQELDEEDFVQASEKLWGAAAQMVKAVAERRGWRHDGHRPLYQVVGRLAQETGDSGLSSAFAAAQGLHFNFYENVWPREIIEDNIPVIQEFMGKLERL